MEWSDKQIRILEIAEKLFAENGYDGTSIRKISKEAGINIAMISYYFGSKDKLLSSLIEYRNSGFTLELENVIAKSNNYTEKLEEITSIIITRVNRNRRIYKIIHFQYSRSKDSLFDFETYINQKKNNIKILDSFIKSGQENGAFKKNINSILIIPTVLGSYFHFYYNKSFFMQLLDIKNKKSFETYIKNELTEHIQQTIKSLIIEKQ